MAVLLLSHWFLCFQSGQQYTLRSIGGNFVLLSTLFFLAELCSFRYMSSKPSYFTSLLLFMHVFNLVKENLTKQELPSHTYSGSQNC